MGAAAVGWEIECVQILFSFSRRIAFGILLAERLFITVTTSSAEQDRHELDVQRRRGVGGDLYATGESMVTHMGRAYFNEIGKIDR